MNNFFFFKDKSEINLNLKDLFIAEISSVNSEDDLFVQLKNNLKFPDYYGYNWNATYECLTDFHWLDNIFNISLIHNGVLNVEKSVLLIYIDVLKSAMGYWDNNKEKSLKVFFLESILDSQD